MMMVIPTLPVSKYMILPVLEREVMTSVLAVRCDASQCLPYIHSTLLSADNLLSLQFPRPILACRDLSDWRYTGLLMLS